MGFIFSKFSKSGSGAKPPSPNPSPSVAEANQLFEPTHSFWAGYATAPNIYTPPLYLYYPSTIVLQTVSVHTRSEPHIHLRDK